MLRISKLTDYGTLVLAYLADADEAVHSASEIADQTRLKQPTVSKLLKLLANAGLVESTRGANGGYRLAGDARGISAASIIDALEGPVAITECSSDHSACELEPVCRVGGAWQKVNLAIRVALDDICLNDLLHPQRIRGRVDLNKKISVVTELSRS